MDLKLLVFCGQFQNCPEALGCAELSDSIPTFPGIDCQQLQGIEWGQLLTSSSLHCEENGNEKNRVVSCCVGTCSCRFSLWMLPCYSQGLSG